MNTSSSGISSSAILRWAFALIVAAATLAGAPCLAFADDASDNANDTAQAAMVADDGPAEVEKPAGVSEQPASDQGAAASDDAGQESGAATEGEPTEISNEGNDDRFAGNGASDSGTADSDANGSGAADLKVGDSDPAANGVESTNQGNPGDTSTKTSDQPAANDANAKQGNEPGKATTPVLLAVIEEGSPQDEPAASATRRTSTHVVNAAPTPQFTCSDACGQPAAEEGCEDGALSEGVPTPVPPIHSALPNKDAPAPAAPASSWGERHASSGQAYDDLAIIPETGALTITYRQASCTPSRNAHADGTRKGPKRCRSPSSIGR